MLYFSKKTKIMKNGVSASESAGLMELPTLSGDQPTKNCQKRLKLLRMSTVQKMTTLIWSVVARNKIASIIMETHYATKHLTLLTINILVVSIKFI